MDLFRDGCDRAARYPETRFDSGFICEEQQ